MGHCGTLACLHNALVRGSDRAHSPTVVIYPAVSTRSINLTSMTSILYYSTTFSVAVTRVVPDIPMHYLMILMKDDINRTWVRIASNKLRLLNGEVSIYVGDDSVYSLYDVIHSTYYPPGEGESSSSVPKVVLRGRRKQSSISKAYSKL